MQKRKNSLETIVTTGWFFPSFLDRISIAFFAHICCQSQNFTKQMFRINNLENTETSVQHRLYNLQVQQKLYTVCV